MYQQVARQDLEDLRLDAGAAGKHLLQNADQDMPERRAYEGAIGSHFWDSGRQVAAILVAILCNPRS